MTATHAPRMFGSRFSFGRCIESNTLSQHARLASKQAAPPKPQSYKPPTERPSPTPSEPATPPSTSTSSYLWNYLFRSPSRNSASEATKPVYDRGFEASQQVVRTGKLPAKYRSASWRVQSVIVAAPIAIVTSIVLYQRLFMGVEQKRPPVPAGTAVEEETEGT